MEPRALPILPSLAFLLSDCPSLPSKTVDTACNQRAADKVIGLWMFSVYIQRPLPNMDSLYSPLFTDWFNSEHLREQKIKFICPPSRLFLVAFCLWNVLLKRGRRSFKKKKNFCVGWGQDVVFKSWLGGWVGGCCLGRGQCLRSTRLRSSRDWRRVGWGWGLVSRAPPSPKLI